MKVVQHSLRAFVLALLCAAGMGLGLARSARADAWRKAAPDAGRTAASVTALTTQAQRLMEQAERSLPADWTTLCRTTLALDMPQESLASLRGKAMALYELSRDSLRAQAQLRGALVRIERARALAPEDAALQYLQARALAMVDEPGPAWECSATRRDDEAIEVLKQLERAHPSYEPGRIAFELGVLLTRTLRFEEAAAAYERAAALSVEPSQGTTAIANLAETQMLAGHLESAIASFGRAIAQAQGGREHALAVWGLALALDRNGEHDQALERLQRAFGSSSESLSVLRSPGVFFVPTCEIHAYEALGYAARARSLRASGEPAASEVAQSVAAALQAAAASYREYLAEAAAAQRSESSTSSSASAPDSASSASSGSELTTQASYEASARESLDRVTKDLAGLARAAARTRKPRVKATTP